MQPYIATSHRILAEGKWKTNRTGKRALTISGASTTYDCSESFPLLTLKYVPIKSVIAELISFFQGATNAATFRTNGTSIWNQNANENADWLANPFRQGEDDLGPVYGAQWRKWPATKVFNGGMITDAQRKQLEATGWQQIANNNGMDTTKDVWYKEIDQLFECYKKIMINPDDRRIIFQGWNPAVLDEIALPACHVFYQFIANKDTKVLDLCMLQRSNDFFLGDPFNIASASAILYLMAELTGYTPGVFVHHMNDVHFYEPHMDGVQLMLSREERPLPKLEITLKDLEIGTRGGGTKSIPLEVYLKEPLNEFGFNRVIDSLSLDNFKVTGYDPHPAIPVDMMV